MRMSVHSRPSMKYQDGMELRDRKMTKDCTLPLGIGNIRALNGCAGSLVFGSKNKTICLDSIFLANRFVNKLIRGNLR